VFPNSVPGGTPALFTHFGCLPNIFLVLKSLMRGVKKKQACLIGRVQKRVGLVLLVFLQEQAGLGNTWTR